MPVSGGLSIRDLRGTLNHQPMVAHVTNDLIYITARQIMFNRLTFLKVPVSLVSVEFKEM